MRSTFHGLETAKRAIFAQQYAIYTTGHNISNAETAGYSRQRVNMGTMNPLDPVGLNRSGMPGQLGTGVIVRDVVRLRDAFADARFRNQHQHFGEWEVRTDTLMKLEVIFNELSSSPSDDTGLAALIDEFWDAWQTLSNDPQETPRVVVEKMRTMVEAFNVKARQLNDLEKDLTETLDIKYDRVNLLLGQIADLNALITKVELSKDNANDLRDQRDLLVDELSKLVDIRVQTSLDGNGREVYSVVLANDEANVLVSGTTVTELEPGNQEVAGGEISGLIKSLEKVDQYRAELDTLANTLANGEVEVTFPAGTVLAPGGAPLDEPLTMTVNGVNGLHELGWNGKNPPEPGQAIFVTADGSGTVTAANMRVAADLLEDERLLAPSNRVTEDGERLDGNNGIALLMAGLRNASFTFGTADSTLSEGTIGGYYRAYTARLGVESESASKELKNQQLALNSAMIQRASVSAVSLDEEMINLIQFQHAYNAAARNMTAIDEMLDRIINGMGHVGR